MTAIHNMPPIYDENSEILILGSFPSVKSRKAKFYYATPQNRFWSVVAAVFEQDVPQTVEEKRAFLLRNRIALWDVIASCEIEGSSDQSIRKCRPQRPDADPEHREHPANLRQRQEGGTAFQQTDCSENRTNSDLPPLHLPCQRLEKFGAADRGVARHPIPLTDAGNRSCRTRYESGKRMTSRSSSGSMSPLPP